MTRVKILALLVGLVLLFTIPATVSAQRLPPHVFVGMVMMQDGSTAPDGTTVGAWVGGAEVASTTVADGNYILIVDQDEQNFAGETITFQVGGMDAMETGIWIQGGGDELNLTSSGTTEATEATEATVAPEPTAIAMATGATGATGARGPSGPSGPDGAAGPAGARGASGATGSTGPTGSAGSGGPAGAKGDTGPAGSAGTAGPAGAPGLAGAEGDDGSGILGIVALILSIVAIAGAGGAFLLGRRS